MNNCAFDFEKSCAALYERDCKNCSFRKTKEELAAEREKAMARINGLPKYERDAILLKYYRHLARGQ